MAKVIKESEIAALAGIEYQSLYKKKQSNPTQYQLLRLGAICQKNGIEEDLLASLSQLSASAKADLISFIAHFNTKDK